CLPAPLRQHLVALEPDRLDAVPRPAGRHGAERDHFLAAGQERGVVDPPLPDLVVPHDLAGVVEHDDVGVAERRDRADDDLLAVVGDVEAGDPHPGQGSEAARIPARRPGCFGMLSGQRRAPDANDQTSHDDSPSVRVLSHSPEGPTPGDAMNSTPCSAPVALVMSSTRVVRLADLSQMDAPGASAATPSSEATPLGG